MWSGRGRKNWLSGTQMADYSVENHGVNNVTK